MNYRTLVSRTRTVALSAALLGGSFAAVGAASAAAGASPATAAAKHTVKYSVTCSVGIFGTQTLSGSATLTTPASVASGAKFKATAVRITIAVPKSLVNAGYAAGIRSFGGKLSKYTINSSDATPKTLNGAGSAGRVIPKTKLVKNKALTLYIPGKTKSFAMGPWTAGSKGTDTGKVGGETAAVKAYNASGGLVTSITATCKAPTPSKLFTVTVS